MSNKKTDIGLIGLAVMGENLALNMESKNWQVSVYNRTVPGVEEGVVDRFVNGRAKGKNIQGFTDIKDFVASIEAPRKIMMMVRAGSAVDELMEQLFPLLSPGDILIDGGNSNYEDTNRRVELTESKGFFFVGSGVSGGEEGKEVGIIQETGDVALPAVRPVTESAIYDTNFIQLEGTDYKIAYLAYNSFTAGTAEQSEKYNNELRAFSQECKQRGINNLVLDFRYNSGGEMECVQLLADILVPADKLESPFAFLQYNDKQSAQNRDLILDSQLLQGGVNLNLPTVYIITSGTTAGAAEMLINCLKPYMKVVLIGQTTKR